LEEAKACWQVGRNRELGNLRIGQMVCVLAMLF